MVCFTYLQIAYRMLIISGRDTQLQQKRAVHTEVEWITEEIDEAVIVDEDGMPIATSYQRGAPTPAAAPVNHPVYVAATPSPAPAAPPRQEAYINKPIPAPAPAPSPAPAPAQFPVYAPAAPAPAPAPAPVAHFPPEAAERYAHVAAGVAKSDGYGISWTPFAGEEDAVICKPQDQVDEEFSKIAQLQFTTIRTYGVACDQATLAMRGAAANGLRVMLGVFDLSNVAGETHDLVRQVQATGLGWGIVDTITIGNEDVQKGVASADSVIGAINTARGILRGAGYQGPVVHVETHGAILANPQLCSEAAGDYIAANIHPFFNPTTVARSAGKYVKSQVEALRECSARNSWKRSEHRVVVTETGWPTGGRSNGLAIPGRLHQFAAIKSIKNELDNDVYLFSAFDNRWQRDSADTFGAEKHWGLLMG
jgi:exo-beta-1,3-glucanase (GH17 family)